jgi:hypothetical protein
MCNPQLIYSIQPAKCYHNIGIKNSHLLDAYTRTYTGISFTGFTRENEKGTCIIY